MAQTRFSSLSTLAPARGISALCKQLIHKGLLCTDLADQAENIAIKGGQRLADVLAIRFGVAPLSVYRRGLFTALPDPDGQPARSPANAFARPQVRTS